jgi:hypothetical protein
MIWWDQQRDPSLANQIGSFHHDDSARGRRVRMQRLPWHRSISLALSSWNKGGRTTFLLGSIPSCCTDNTRYGQPCDEKVDRRDGICDPGHLPWLPNSECMKRLSVALSIPSVDAVTLYVATYSSPENLSRPSGFDRNS